jgi:hypothetical protein
MDRRALFAAVAALAGCNPDGFVDLPEDLARPTGLTYRLEPSGRPAAPAGIVLRWNAPPDADREAFNVYGRSGGGAAFSLLATTTSFSFHDDGVPRLEYVVRAVGFRGTESAPSNTVVVDERLALPRPAWLSSVSLNGAVALLWADDAARGAPGAFGHYRVYSATYDLDANRCGAAWSLEGTTVAPEFRVGALVNGVPRCFAVSAIAVEGYESLWSPLRHDTPRPDARNVVVGTRQAAPASSGFRFWRDANGNGRVDPGELGRVGPGAAPDADFAVDRDGAGRIWLVPVRTGTTVVPWGAGPVADLTDIDVAPASGYGRAPVEALPGFGFVFRMDGGDGFHRFGALRITHAGPTLVIVDWAFQTDPGNRELVIGR